MTKQELDLHKIQMLQLTLQRIQGLEEKQALGIVLTPQNLNMMGQRQGLSDQLACLKFNLSMADLNDIKRVPNDGLRGDIDLDDEEEDDKTDDAAADALVLNYDDGASSDEDE